MRRSIRYTSYRLLIMMLKDYCHEILYLSYVISSVAKFVIFYIFSKFDLFSNKVCKVVINHITKLVTNPSSLEEYRSILFCTLLCSVKRLNCT